MKRYIFLLIVISIFALLLIGCDQAQSSEAEPPKTSDLSKEDAEIRNISDKAIMEQYGLSASDLSTFYRINIYEKKDGIIVVNYSLVFFGYETYERLWVNLTPDHQIESVYGDSCEFACYIPNITEEAIKKAENNLNEKTKNYEKTSLTFFNIDEEGYLCLCSEYILTIDPPVTDDEGNALEGCGYDHEHIVINERVCAKP